MDVGSVRQGGDVAPPWIFIHGTDIVDRGLIVLFFGLLLFFGLFPLPSPPPLEIFLPTPLHELSCYCASYLSQFSCLMFSTYKGRVKHGSTIPQFARCVSVLRQVT